MDQQLQAELWAETARLAVAVQKLGDRHSLPFIAAQSDLGDPEPMHDERGRTYAETHFKWMDPNDRYWDNRRLALDSLVLNAARLMAEPFAFHDGALHCWRKTSVLGAFDCSRVTPETGVTGSIVAPVHLPRGRLGAVVWATTGNTDVQKIYADCGFAMHEAAIKLIATHAEASAKRDSATGSAHLTRREVQCIRWGAQGKTDVEIGIILSLSVSTVRFHLRNAAEKLGTTGRAQTIRHAAGLGFIGSRNG